MTWHDPFEDLYSAADKNSLAAQGFVPGNLVTTLRGHPPGAVATDMRFIVWKEPSFSSATLFAYGDNLTMIVAVDACSSDPVNTWLCLLNASVGLCWMPAYKCCVEKP